MLGLQREQGDVCEVMGWRSRAERIRSKDWPRLCAASRQVLTLLPGTNTPQQVSIITIRFNLSCRLMPGVWMKERKMKRENT